LKYQRVEAKTIATMSASENMTTNGRVSSIKPHPLYNASICSDPIYKQRVHERFRFPSNWLQLPTYQQITVESARDACEQNETTPLDRLTERGVCCCCCCASLLCREIDFAIEVVGDDCAVSKYGTGGECGTRQRLQRFNPGSGDHSIRKKKTRHLLC
jgi:hypothetical protein